MSVVFLGLPRETRNSDSCEMTVNHVTNMTDGHVDILSSFFKVTGVKEVPPTSSASSQRYWDTLSATVSRDRMVDSANQLHRARLVAASEPPPGYRPSPCPVSVYTWMRNRFE